MDREVNKSRYIVLTDINYGIELDDIESMIRLMLYSNEIEIEGLIATTSIWLKEGGTEKNRQIILDIIDAYAQVKPNLDCHAEGYPDPDKLRQITKVGIEKFGKRIGNGWGEECFNTNPGVKLIIDAVDRKDPRPVWIGVWGGTNTLAHAVWLVWKTRNNSEFNKFLSKLRIYNISDQDYASHWLRKNFGDRLFNIVSPSPANKRSYRFYENATWTGIAESYSRKDLNLRSKTGDLPKEAAIVSQGGNCSLVDHKWLKEHICNKGLLGQKYPLFTFRMEGDSPSFLYLLPHGLADPEHPNYGSWGGRYEKSKPLFWVTGTIERFPVWTDSSDSVIGFDGKVVNSPQATIFRWREAYQNDFAARMLWSKTDDYKRANHPPLVKLDHAKKLIVKSGDTVSLSAIGTIDPDGDNLTFEWIYYPEAGSFRGEIIINDKNAEKVTFIAPSIVYPVEIHIILIVKDNGTPPLFGYQRIIVSVSPSIVA
jgi:hypothetical protein